MVGTEDFVMDFGGDDAAERLYREGKLPKRICHCDTKVNNMMFDADYINGDTYYKIKYPEHNWDRTRNQWALFCSARECVPEMKKALGL